MKRKEFLQRGLGGVFGLIALPSVFAKSSEDEHEQKVEQVGFNHLPNKEIKTMKTVLHKAATRGHANHGWLDSHHTFSFANYYNPERMRFGVLRVLNDDVVDGGMGFGTHPHDNMEIISIPISGDLEHKDSMGNTMVIRQNDVQIMSAGTGITHSEYNKNKDKKVNFLQIWVFPKERQIKPAYGQQQFLPATQQNKLIQVVSPAEDKDGLTIHQDAWFSLGRFDAGKSFDYSVKRKGNGAYVFVIEGELKIGDQALSRRDGFGIWETEKFSVEITGDAHVLIMDVPMN